MSYKFVLQNNNYFYAISQLKKIIREANLMGSLKSRKAFVPKTQRRVAKAKKIVAFYKSTAMKIINAKKEKSSSNGK